MHPVTVVLLVICILLLAGVIALYIFGKKAQKKKEEQDAQIAASAQVMSILVIDKKKLPMKEAGLPEAVIAQTPKLLRRSKVPIVKAKVGPKVMNLICDAEVFEYIPVKKEVKAICSGLYISGIKGVRGKLEKPEKKKGFFARIKAKVKKEA